MESNTGLFETNNSADEYVGQLLGRSAALIVEHLRFIKAISERIRPVIRRGTGEVCLENGIFCFDPNYILEKKIEDRNYPLRIVLHSLCHAMCVHIFIEGRPNMEMWNLACDIAVENLIVDLDIKDFALVLDDDIRQSRREIKRYCADMTAENIYRYFLAHPPSEDAIREYERIYARDAHFYQKSTLALEANEREWRKISDRIKIELKVFSKESRKAEIFMANLNEATRPRYDYKKLLEKFCQDRGGVMVSEDEFDYIYYTYGITQYDGMPFVEPLEYTKERDVRDFVIVLDTTASCRPEIIRSFLQKTYSIIDTMNRCSDAVHLHIIKGPKGELGDRVIRSREELDAFTENIRPDPGGTDFRPAIDYVDTLLRKKVFRDFRGLIYCTDGFGVFPGKNPGYDCIFAFISGRFGLPEVPWWATPIILDEDALQS